MEAWRAKLRFLYIGAGHAQRGGAAGKGLVEAIENIDTVEDAEIYLERNAGMGAGRPLEGVGTEYALGDKVLVVVDHALDLTDTIRVLNADYVRRCRAAGLNPDDPDYGLGMEVHFNAPSATAIGPMVLHTNTRLSEQVGQAAAEEMGRATGLPVRHFYNHWRKWPNGTTGYGFINFTKMRTIIIEGDEMLNAARARVIGDPDLDNIYGTGVAALLMRAAGIPDEPLVGQRGMHLGWGVPIDWDRLRVMGIRAVGTVHAWQLPKKGDPLADEFIWLWRPYLDPGWLLSLTPGQAMRCIEGLYEDAGGERVFHWGQIGNEPNLDAESGMARGSQEALTRFLPWWDEVVAAFRRRFPHAVVTSTPLSPGPGCRHREWYQAMGKHMLAADAINLHAYWGKPEELYGQAAADNALEYLRILGMYAGADMVAKPACISEFGMHGANGQAGYGDMVSRFWRMLPARVRFGLLYLHDVPAGSEWKPWAIAGTPAEDEIVATAPAEGKYARLWGGEGRAPYIPGDPICRYFRSMVDAGRYPGPAEDVLQGIGVDAALFERCVVVAHSRQVFDEFWKK